MYIRNKKTNLFRNTFLHIPNSCIHTMAQNLSIYIYHHAGKDRVVRKHLLHSEGPAHVNAIYQQSKTFFLSTLISTHKSYYQRILRELKIDFFQMLQWNKLNSKATHSKNSLTRVTFSFGNSLTSQGASPHCENQNQLVIFPPPTTTKKKTVHNLINV